MTAVPFDASDIDWLEQFLNDENCKNCICLDEQQNASEKTIFFKQEKDLTPEDNFIRCDKNIDKSCSGNKKTVFSVKESLAPETEAITKICSNGYSKLSNDYYSQSPKVPLCTLSEVQLRFLCPSDLEEVRALCKDWFPIDYPEAWFQDITSSSRFYALAAVYGGIIIGLIVAEIKPYAKLNNEDRGILCSSFGLNSLVGYILSLGVRKSYRRNGIASLLLDQLIAHVTAPERSSVKALFLHVLSSNTPAIHFYKRCHFRLHSFLPYYYFIKGRAKDGFTYVLYVNSGHAPRGIRDWIRHLGSSIASLSPCKVPRWILQRLLWAATLFFYHR